MRPGDVFKDMVTAEWTTLLCRFLITRKSFIEQTLAERYEAFCDSISHWRDEHLEHLTDDQIPEDTAAALFDICAAYGIIELGPFGGVGGAQRLRMRGGVRTRGVGRTRGDDVLPAGNVMQHTWQRSRGCSVGRRSHGSCGRRAGRWQAQQAVVD
jgi:hypothetical protein